MHTLPLKRLSAVIWLVLSCLLFLRSKPYAQASVGAINRPVTPPGSVAGRQGGRSDRPVGSVCPVGVCCLGSHSGPFCFGFC